MGGAAFAHGPKALNTPRMPQDVYQASKERCKKALRRLYHCVACPIEGPGKSDFGDLDIFVAWAKGSSGADPRLDIQIALGAEFVILGCDCSQYAIPWPDAHAITGDPPSNDSERRFIQVDVTICQSLEAMQWSLFKHAHGDLWSILGSIIRPYGLTIDEMCLSIRIPELERSDRKKSRVPLTTEPADVLSFIGLPGGKFWEEPFPSRQDMYYYLTQCPMFRVSPLNSGVTLNLDNSVGQMDLKAGDRKRLNTRPVFREWIESFVHQCRNEGRFVEQRTTREAVLQGAFSRFRVQDEYQRRLNCHLIEQQAVYIKSNLIKGLFPAHEGLSAASKEIQYRGCLVKALTRIVVYGDTTYGVIPDHNAPLKDDSGFFVMENVLHFINNNHEAVGAAAMARHHQACLERKLASSSAPPKLKED